MAEIAFAAFTPALNQSRGDAFVTLFDSRDILAQNLIMQQKLGAKNVAEVQQDLASTKSYFDTVEKPTADKLGLKIQPFYYSESDRLDLVRRHHPVDATPTASTSRPPPTPVCLAAIPALKSAGFTGTIHASSCAEFIDKLPPDDVERRHQPQRVLLPDDDEHPGRSRRATSTSSRST